MHTFHFLTLDPYELELGNVVTLSSIDTEEIMNETRNAHFIVVLGKFNFLLPSGRKLLGSISSL